MVPVHQQFESVNDSLRAAVEFLGGYKVVGSRMRPELPADQAGTWLRGCLKDGRREVLSPERLYWLQREARRAGYLEAAAFAMDDWGYAPPVPLEPEDEAAQLQREFIAGVAQFKALASRLDRIAEVLGRSNVAPLQVRRA